MIGNYSNTKTERGQSNEPQFNHGAFNKMFRALRYKMGDMYDDNARFQLAFQLGVNEVYLRQYQTNEGRVDVDVLLKVISHFYPGMILSPAGKLVPHTSEIATFWQERQALDGVEYI